MKNLNRHSPLEFILWNILCGAEVLYCYRGLVFLPLPGWEQTPSLMLLMQLTGLLVPAGCLMTIVRRRNFLSVYVNVMSPAALYFVLSFRQVYRRELLWAGGAALLLSAGYLLVVLWVYAGERRDRRRRRREVPLRKCLAAAGLGVRTIVVVLLSVLVLIAAVEVLTGKPLMEPVSAAQPGQSANGEVTLEARMDALLLLQEENWELLDVDGRMKVMETAAELEAAHLGIPRVELTAKVLAGNTYGSYEHTENTVTLNLTQLERQQGSVMLRTLAHEMYHAYQYQLVRLYETADDQSRALYVLRPAAEYREEFANYIYGADDYDAYDAQRCERDSDSYAEEAVQRYYQQIQTYLEQTGGKT